MPGHLCSLRFREFNESLQNLTRYKRAELCIFWFGRKEKKKEKTVCDWSMTHGIGSSEKTWRIRGQGDENIVKEIKYNAS